MKFVAWGVISMGHSLKSHIKNCEDSRLRRMRIISKDEKKCQDKKGDKLNFISVFLLSGEYMGITG